MMQPPAKSRTWWRANCNRPSISILGVYEDAQDAKIEDYVKDIGHVNIFFRDITRTKKESSEGEEEV